MKVITLDRNDLNEMIKSTVRSVLREAVSETMGSAMAGKEKAIQDIVDYIKNRWEEILNKKEKPINSGGFNLGETSGLQGEFKAYQFQVPYALTEKLDIAEKFDIFVTINNYIAGPEVIEQLEHWERSSEGGSYAGGKYNAYFRPKMHMAESRIDITTPAVNNELQIPGLTSTLYHELNHNMTYLKSKIKKQDKFNDEEINDVSLLSMSQRKDQPPHFVVQRELHPDPMRSLLQGLSYGAYEEAHKAMNFIFYGLWEITERNARAESIYGDLMAMNSKRENFRTDFPKTDLYYQLGQFKELLDTVSKVPATADNWKYAANVMNMHPKNYDLNVSKEGKKFFKKVKQRFIERTNELIGILYKKAMKVAEYYYQEHEPKPQKSRLEKYKEKHGR